MTLWSYGWEPDPSESGLAAPFREAEFDLIYGEGISKEAELTWESERSGWFSFGGERIGQGRENSVFEEKWGRPQKIEF